MKVFLSHSTKDKQFVQTLAAELEAEKIEPWLC
jgi:TIR domain